jgi:DnaJ homolog subfamily C member 19
LIKLLLFVVLIGVVGWMVMRAMTPPVRMPRADAAKLLGLDPAAGTEAVLDAHRRLIAKVHPDAGGSAELAARINEARDIMLKS